MILCPSTIHLCNCKVSAPWMAFHSAKLRSSEADNTKAEDGKASKEVTSCK